MQISLKKGKIKKYFYANKGKKFNQWRGWPKRGAGGYQGILEFGPGSGEPNLKFEDITFMNGSVDHDIHEFSILEFGEVVSHFDRSSAAEWLREFGSGLSLVSLGVSHF